MNGSDLFDYVIVLFVVIALPTVFMSFLAELARKKDRKK